MLGTQSFYVSKSVQKSHRSISLRKIKEYFKYQKLYSIMLIKLDIGICCSQKGCYLILFVCPGYICSITTIIILLFYNTLWLQVFDKDTNFTDIYIF